MSIRAWFANKLAQAQASAENQMKVEISSTAKIVSENNYVAKTYVQKAKELNVTDDELKRHLNVNWWDDTPAPAEAKVDLIDLIKNMTPEQKKEVKKLLS